MGSDSEKSHGSGLHQGCGARGPVGFRRVKLLERRCERGLLRLGPSSGDGEPQNRRKERPPPPGGRWGWDRGSRIPAPTAQAGPLRLRKEQKLF